MYRNFPGHYTPLTISSPSPSHKTLGNLINMSEKARSIDERDFDHADVPLSSTLYTSPNSPVGRASHAQPFREESDQGSRQADMTEVFEEPSPPPRTPTPVYHHHPRYYFSDGTLFILVDDILFRLHAYHFTADSGNAISKELGEDQTSERHPIFLPKEVKISSFENLLSIIYRRPLESDPIPIKILKDACLTANALGLGSICSQIAKHIILTDCPDESLDEAVPKYTLAIKLPDHFPRNFKETQVDKLCCAALYMSHSHFYELGFTELGKVWKAALVARAGYDGQKMETYEPPAEQARASYLIKVKNVPGYRAIKKELFR